VISSRFAIVVNVLLVIALVPTIIHSHVKAKVENGLLTNAVSKTLAGLSSNATARRGAWVKDTFNSHDWMERRYTGQNNQNVLLFIARSFDLKRLYHHPEIGVLRGVDLEKVGIRKLPEMPDVPIHVLKSRTGKGFAAYVLLCDGQFIENPIRFQLLSSVKLLFSSRKPMTLFLVYDGMAYASFQQSPAKSVLLDALKSFLSQKPGSEL
jgi:hypothetical protein